MKRALLIVAALVGIGVGFGALTIFVWTIGEEHFDRPDEEFDRLAAQIERAPGVDVDAMERWVEAPTFSDPVAWIQLSVDEEHLPGLLDIACADEYRGVVDWSFHVRTHSGNTVSLYTGPTPGTAVDHTPCPDFGFDAVGVVGEVGRSAPGVDVQASIWDNGRFALVVLGDDQGALASVLPLVDHAEAVLAAAGLDPGQPVEINGASLGVVIQPGEQDRYLALLTDLAENRGVTSFWADGGGDPVDGVEKVQVAAPDREHSAIEVAVRASGLRVADYPVRFLPLSP